MSRAPALKQTLMEWQREIAAQMHVLCTESQSEAIAEVIAADIDDVTAARIVNVGCTPSPIMVKTFDKIARLTRGVYFLHVGQEIGLELGYTIENDREQLIYLAEVFNAAYSEANQNATTELKRFPPVAAFIREALAVGFDYCHVTETDDGIIIKEWRRIIHQKDTSQTIDMPHRDASEGAAYTAMLPNGVVVYEEYAQHGLLHREGAPAVIERDPTGKITCERYVTRGVEQRQVQHA